MKNLSCLAGLMVLLCLLPYQIRSHKTTVFQKRKKDGWVLLFDGTSLTNWRTFKNIPGNWAAKDGMLCSEKPINKENPDILSNDVYENFELQVDWKLSPQGNSGILYHVTEDYDATFTVGRNIN